MFCLFLLLDQLRNMLMSHDSLDFSMMSKFLLQGIHICYFLLLSFIHRHKAFWSFSFPDSHISVFTSRYHILAIHWVNHGVDLLHSFCMINLSASSWKGRENSKSFIKRTRYKLLSMWRKVDWKDGIYMIFVYQFNFRKFSHVKRVAIAIFISYDEIKWFVRIPTNTWRFIL